MNNNDETNPYSNFALEIDRALIKRGIESLERIAASLEQLVAHEINNETSNFFAGENEFDEESKEYEQLVINTFYGPLRKTPQIGKILNKFRLSLKNSEKISTDRALKELNCVKRTLQNYAKKRPFVVNEMTLEDLNWCKEHQLSLKEKIT